jgi:hypothetical protein
LGCVAPNVSMRVGLGDRNISRAPPSSLVNVWRSRSDQRESSSCRSRHSLGPSEHRSEQTSCWRSALHCIHTHVRAACGARRDARGNPPRGVECVRGVVAVDPRRTHAVRDTQFTSHWKSRRLGTARIAGSPCPVPGHGCVRSPVTGCVLNVATKAHMPGAGRAWDGRPRNPP